MVNTAYFTELILQICDYAQKRRIWRGNCKYALDEIFIAIFSPDERLPSSATLRSTTSLLIFVSADNIRRVVFDCLTKLWWWFWSANILVVYSLWNWCGREGKVDSFTAWNRVCQRYHLNHHQGQHKQNFIQPQNNINIKTNINNIFTI